MQPHLSVLALCLTAGLAAPTLAFDDWDGLHAAVVGIGDADGDGAEDLVVAHRPRPFGMGNAPTETLKVVEQLPRIWALSGTDGRVLWSTTGHARFGTRVAAVGDLDGDGVDEVATAEDVPRDARVPAPVQEPTEQERAAGREPVALADLPDPHAGRARVVVLSGATGERLVELAPPSSPHHFGTGFAGGLQVVGDRTPDLVVGSHGHVWVVDGATFEPVRGFRLARDGRVHRADVEGWDRPTGPEEVSWAPADKRDHGDFGNNLALVPDLDGDGAAELVIGGKRPRDAAAQARILGEDEGEPGERSSWVLFSAGSLADLCLDSSAWRAVALDDLDGDGMAELATTTVDQHLRVWSLGRQELLWGSDWSGGYMHAEGTSLAVVADRDGDGKRDLLLAANETAIDCDVGFVSVVSAATGAGLVSSWTDRSAATPEELRPPMDGGFDADLLGDLDEDGFEELAVMTPVYQEVRVLDGEDLEVRWARTFDALLAEATAVEVGADGESEAD